MLTKTKMALAAMLLFGVASAAQAGSKDDADAAGGYRVGPSGQSFNGGVNPVYHRSLRGNAGQDFALFLSRSQKVQNSDRRAHVPW